MKPNMLFIKEARVRKDELINFNQTSIFKCWKWANNTGNKMKGSAIPEWQFSPQRNSSSHMSLVKIEDLAKMVKGA